VHLVRDPDAETALTFLQESLKGLQDGRGQVLQVVGDCRVSYQGRAQSTLLRGERLVLLKPDGTLLIHTSAKAKPINWQPPGAQFHAALEEGEVALTAYRPKPEEMVKIVFHRIDLLLAFPLHDAADLALIGSEDDLQRILFENPDLVEAGFVPQRRERDSKRGFYDLDGRDATGRRLIVEVKRTTAGVQEAQQLWRYVEGLDSARGILIAPSVAPKARALLASHNLSWKELDWNEILPRIEHMRRGGQTGLERYG